MLKVHRIFFSVAFVWCLVLGNSFADETRTCSLDLTSEDAELHIDNLVPGVKNSFCLLIRNRTGSDLSFEAIRPSCGCMIVAPVQKQFRNEESLSIPVSLLVDSSNPKFGRVLTKFGCWAVRSNAKARCNSPLDPKDSFVFDGFHPSMVRCIHVNGNAEVPKVLFDQWHHVCPCKPANTGC